MLLGAPGTGKTTYIGALSEFLTNLDRPHCIVNLDPANENMSYKCGINIQDLISLEDAMTEFKLGPNGGIIYCMEFLEENLQWIKERIEKKQEEEGINYFIFDLPGQVELYTNHGSLKKILKGLQEAIRLDISAVHLVDCSYLYDKHRFLSAMMLSLSAIIGLEMPFINVISKIDLLKSFGRPDAGLTFYENCGGLSTMFFAPDNDSPFGVKHHSLSKQLCELLERMNLVGFTLLDL
jgi:GTPase SAR1 family protein